MGISPTTSSVALSISNTLRWLDSDTKTSPSGVSANRTGELSGWRTTATGAFLSQS